MIEYQNGNFSLRLSGDGLIRRETPYYCSSGGGHGAGIENLIEFLLFFP
jgi:hypothetical protein